MTSIGHFSGTLTQAGEITRGFLGFKLDANGVGDQRGRGVQVQLLTNMTTVIGDSRHANA